MKPIILGSGLAGLMTALALAPMPVILVSSSKLGQSCASQWAQGGIAAALGKNDSVELHAEDTLAVGNGLNDEKIVFDITQDAPHIIEDLMDRGVLFEHDTDGLLKLGLEAAHRKRRIVHAKDATGQALMTALVKAVRAQASIEVIEDAFAENLFVEEALTGVGLSMQDTSFVLETSCVVLATGGAAALWRDTTNPHSNWGSGLALAARAGATLGDLEFMQFHPTALDVGQDPMPLISEAVRGEGACLVDAKGERFVDELQGRDIVAAALWKKIASGQKVFLDTRQVMGNNFSHRFPAIYKACREAGIDPHVSLIPVRPAAHYHMGGVVTDIHGRTDVKNLWACGEIANTGLHGANRLASNSLLEAAAFGKRVAQDIQNTHFSKTKPRSLCAPASLSVDDDPTLSLTIRKTMSECVGITRSKESLEKAAIFFAPLVTAGGSARDKALVGLMITQAALQREETRGAHMRSDYSDTHAKARRSHFSMADMEDFQ